MKKVLFDINVLLDFLTQRKNHVKAAQVFDAVVNKKVKGYLAVHELTTLAYFLEKDKYARKHVATIISNILDIFSIISVNETILRKALNSKIKDFEDAVLDEASIKESLDYIITNNLKDFKAAGTQSMAPEQILGIINL